jgi:hypothetical protein
VSRRAGLAVVAWIVFRAVATTRMLWRGGHETVTKRRTYTTVAFD